MTGGRRLRIALVFGGRSAEHEVSLRSACAVASHLDPEKYEVLGIGVTREGRWLISRDDLPGLLDGAMDLQAAPTSRSVALVADPSVGSLLTLDGKKTLLSSAPEPRPDVVFPLIHGTHGEDGSLQGMLELAAIPYVGCGVLASALGMDKAAFKTVMRAHGIPVVPYHLICAGPEAPEPRVRRRWHDLADELAYPLFVKPANAGSSVGVAKVKRREHLIDAIATAAAYDRRVLLERAIAGRELDCGVLGNDEPEVSIVGETIRGHEFHDYEDKYFDDKARCEIPARLGAHEAAAVQELSRRAFVAIDGAGMARVDFFLEHDTGELFVNEINTIPGFSRRSTYPRLWQASGLPFPLLLERLVELAIERGSRARKVRP